MGRKSNYSPEFREEAARLVIETQRPIVQVARELGISNETLRNWVRRYKDEHSSETTDLDASDRARLRELERRNAELERENSFLKKPQRTSRRITGSLQVRVHGDSENR